MDPHTSAQDVSRCDLCETAVVQMHCDTCLVNLCMACVGDHMMPDQFKKHEIVPFQLRKSTPLYPRCTTHSKERCEMYCYQCDISVCNTCIASDHHLGHKFITILQILDEKKNKIIKAHTELKETIYPTYQDIASDVQNRMSQLEKEYGDLSTAITKHGEDLHREIDKLVKKLKAEVDEMKNTQLQTLQKHLDEINKKIFDIEDEIDAVNATKDSNDLSKLFSVKLSLDKYKKLPPKIVSCTPKFMPGKVQEKELHDMIGAVTPSSLTSGDYCYSMKFSLPEPESVTTIYTGYRYLYNVACLNDEEIWTSGDDNTMKLFSINQGSLLKSITAKSGKIPCDIAVTKSGDLVYTDYHKKSVNIVKNKKTEKMIKLQNWIPLGVCNTSSLDLLVIMYSDDDNKQTKVVRYSGSTEKQTIQFDDKGKPLYSSSGYYRYVAENRNLDICVSDSHAREVVVVNQAGILRFVYTGEQNKSFCPRGITTDSQSHILTADIYNDCIHIIDQDGQFIRYIECALKNPYGLCIDTNDNLFVAQYRNIQVKKIKYLQ
ncbi:uncharacterized protein LOC134236450 [Saccostrea cucullata]|uniref:uncharacterized protein LOC134236450 n=1 Tax=Saccostrea cuccullata TaxID=36930 RepID=UPI002ED2D5DB